MQLTSSCVHTNILTGPTAGQRVFIPRITLIHTDDKLPYSLKRRQFPVQISFAKTINKSQGETIKKFGIYLEQPVFSHGHIYVAFSRCSDPRNKKILLENEKTDKQESM